MTATGVACREGKRPPRIVWADLVIRVPLHQGRTKGAPKATHDSAPAAGTKLHPGGEGQNPRQRGRKTDLPRRCQEGIRGAKAEDGRKAVSPPRQAAPSSSPPEKRDPREGGAVRTILVDLRPVLERAVDLSDSSPERSVRDLQDGEEPPETESGDLPSEEARDPSEAAKPGSTDSATHKGTLLPLARGSPQAPSPCASSTRKPPEICPELGDSAELRETTPLAALTQGPNLGAAVSLPTNALEEPGADHLLQQFMPSASPSDFQLPTKLLLQRLEEATTSRHHSLIAQVLGSLRGELLAGEQLPLGDGHEATSLPHRPSPKDSEKKEGNDRKPSKLSRAAAERLIGKFTWHRCHRSVYGARVASQATDL